MMLCEASIAIVTESGRRDSDPRISAWKADALPLGDARVVLPLPLVFPAE